MKASQKSGFPASGSLLEGDASLLLRQMAADEALPELGGAASAFRGRNLKTIEDLRRHSLEYQTQVLHPIELPAVIRAWQFASHGGARELSLLDNELSSHPALHELAVASQRVGRIHLKRLRPLRDHRVVQRYLAAIERGESTGWHMIVYGLILSVYSIPLRQGLIHYGCASIRGLLLGAGSNTCQGTEAALTGLEREGSLSLPGAVGHAIASSGAEGLFSAEHLAKTPGS
jgi:hypothetical protein